MTAPTLTLPPADFASPVSLTFDHGVYTATRLPIPSVCVCPDGTCIKCFLRDDAAFERSQDF
jgi:hypothetical protein